MKKYLTLEVLIDETMEDSKECALEVISEATDHYFCCDGTVRINIVERVNEEDEDALNFTCDCCRETFKMKDRNIRFGKEVCPICCM